MSVSDDVLLTEIRWKCLGRANIKYIGDLIQKSQKEVQRIHGIGTANIRRIEKLFKEMDLCFGTPVPNWDELKRRYEMALIGLPASYRKHQYALEAMHKEKPPSSKCTIEINEQLYQRIKRRSYYDSLRTEVKEMYNEEVECLNREERKNILIKVSSFLLEESGDLNMLICAHSRLEIQNIIDQLEDKE